MRGVSPLDAAAPPAAAVKLASPRDEPACGAATLPPESLPRAAAPPPLAPALPPALAPPLAGVFFLSAIIASSTLDQVAVGLGHTNLAAVVQHPEPDARRLVAFRIHQL